MFGGTPESVQVFDVKRIKDGPEIFRHEEEQVRWFGFSRCNPREDDIPSDSDAHFHSISYKNSGAERKVIDLHIQSPP